MRAWGAAWAALASFVLVGCTEEWTPESYPVNVVVLSEVTSLQRNAITTAVQSWNERVGEEVFNLRFEPGEPIACGQIHVFLTEHMENHGAQILGEADIEGFRQCQASVRIRPDMPRLVTTRTTTHELGHVLLGPDHSKDERSVMFWEQLSSVQEITDEDLELARKAIEAVRAARATMRQDMARASAPVVD